MPDTHPLESWGDARAFDGTVTLTQPLIEPLYEGRSAHELLGAFTAEPDRRDAGDRQGLLDEDVQQRLGRLDLQESARRVVRECRRVLALGAARGIHRRHLARRRGAGDGADPGRPPSAPHRRHGGAGAAASRRDGAAPAPARTSPPAAHPAAGPAAAPAALRAGASKSSSVRIPRSGTAASPTTAGCRSCRSPIPRSRGTRPRGSASSSRTSAGLREGDLVTLTYRGESMPDAGVRGARSSGADR